jgi:hypothetical protein
MSTDEVANQEKTSKPRAHHFAPQCWLAGFTDSGDKTGRLWVTDIERRKQWPSSPPNAGHERDFYRVSTPGLDPFGFETELAEIEGIIAPLLKNLYFEPRAPTPAELADLLVFAGLQYVRVPAFRPTMLNVADDMHTSRILEDLKTPASWQDALRSYGIPLDSPGADYQQMQSFIKEKRYTLSAPTEWFLMHGFKGAMDTIIPTLQQRGWGTLISSTGSFVASDNPLTMDGLGKIGFKTAEVITFPVNRHLLLYSFHRPLRPRRTSLKLIARHNTLTMLGASQIYSHVSDFVWLNHSDRCCDDWTRFSKSDFEVSPQMLQE